MVNDKNPKKILYYHQNVSYFESYNPELYPTVSDINLVSVLMDNEDYIQNYIKVRTEEIEIENKSKERKQRS